MAEVEFLFDFGSPNAYLAEFVIPSIERRTGVKFAEMRPQPRSPASRAM